MSKRTTHSGRINKFKWEVRNHLVEIGYPAESVATTAFVHQPYPASGIGNIGIELFALELPNNNWEMVCQVKCAILTLCVSERGVRGIHPEPLTDGTLGQFSPQSIAYWFATIAGVGRSFQTSLYFREYLQLTNRQSYLKYTANYCHWNHEGSGESFFAATLFPYEDIVRNKVDNPPWFRPSGWTVPYSGDYNSDEVKTAIGRFGTTRAIYAIVNAVSAQEKHVAGRTA